MPALFAADRAFARPEFLEDSGPFLLPVGSAIGPHVPAVRARQPPWNCGVKVFHVIVVASRAFWLRRLLDPQRDDPRFLLCDLILHDAVTNILASGPFVHNRRTRAARDARPVPGVPGGPHHRGVIPKLPASRQQMHDRSSICSMEFALLHCEGRIANQPAFRNSFSTLKPVAFLLRRGMS
jgi:hypothetical protein